MALACSRSSSEQTPGGTTAIVEAGSTNNDPMVIRAIYKILEHRSGR